LKKIAIIGLVVAAIVPVAIAVYAVNDSPSATPSAQASAPTPIALKEAKLNIEHNATDNDTGFPGDHRQ
jgi:hypothetical protein